MNLSTLNRLGAKAKPTAQAIARFCEREGIGYEFEPSRRGHPSVRLTMNRQSRKVFFSGTPGDQRVIENVLQNVRKEARSMGWKPRKETPVETVARTLSDLPKVVERSEPAPSVVKRYDPPAPDIPRPPERWVNRSYSAPEVTPELSKALEARNEWIFEQKRSGRKSPDIYLDLTRVGWSIKSAANIDATYSTMRQKLGLSKPRSERPENPEPEAVPGISTPNLDPLVLAIAEAIAPMVREQLAKQSQEIQALRAKADKWDAIAGLVKEA